MYDMYPWDSASPGGRPPRARGDAPLGAINAVQIALDRRDNGGDATAEVGAASTPTAGPTRQ